MSFYKHYTDLLKTHLSPSAEKVLMVLINRAEFHNNKPFYCYEKWIASEINKSERTIKRAIKKLSEDNYISIERVYNKNTRKSINIYTVNTLPTDNGVVNTPDVSGEIDEIINIEKEVLNEKITNEQTNKDMYNEQNEIPLDILYPYEQDDIEAQAVFTKSYQNKNTAVVIPDEMKQGVKKYLMDNYRDGKTNMVYYPAIHKLTQCTYKQLIDIVKEMDEEGLIKYNPEEKNGKIYHYYTKVQKFNQKKFDDTINRWMDVVITQMQDYKKRGCTPMAKQDMLNTLAGYAPHYLIEGVTKADLNMAIQLIHEKYINYEKSA